jgi:hypothetical protein
MAGMTRLRPPVAQKLLDGDRLATVWATHFQDVADQMARIVPSGTIYANDAAAAAGGVPLGGLYFDGAIVRARLV